MSPDPKQHFGALTGLILASADGELIFNCVHCHREISDGEGALAARSGESWQARCHIHDEHRPWQIPVEKVRTAEQVLIELAGWVEVSWTPDFTALVVALSRALRNARLSELERLRDEEARSSGDEQDPQMEMPPAHRGQIQ